MFLLYVINQIVTNGYWVSYVGPGARLVVIVSGGGGGELVRIASRTGDSENITTS